MATIEFVHGQESHTSTWRKFYVKGLEKWKVAEDFDEERNDKHYCYNGYCCIAIPEGILFTIFSQAGDKRGTDHFEFYICECTDDQVQSTIELSPCFCRGNFRIIAQGLTKIKASRLMDWWINSRDKSLMFAEHCASHIDKRGLKQIPPINK